MRALFSGFIKVHILHHASEEPVFGLGIIKELARHGYDISPGTLYPALHSLEREGLIASESKTTNGRTRKYYTATQKGRMALETIKPKLKELADEILDTKKRM